MTLMDAITTRFFASGLTIENALFMIFLIVFYAIKTESNIC